ncbi:MAG: hypothetical protein COA57_08355 [Flavobacteriales bacterium]|nr:MAG: hypothetical protein COA57_08355 [Flavobacteriales bacterium]
MVIIIFIVLGILLLIDVYAFKGIRMLTNDISSSNVRYSIHLFYWFITIFAFSGIIYASGNASIIRSPKYMPYFFNFIGILTLFMVPKLVFVVFHLMEDIIHLVKIIVNYAYTGSDYSGEKISRHNFLTKMGIIIAAIPFISIAYGILRGRYNFRVLRETLSFPNLPTAFDGLRIAVISDIHIGSFGKNRAPVEKGIEMVNALEPDVIFFTGDLVNNMTDETHGWLDTLKNLKAKKGKYSVLGNHDYGDYIPWKSPQAKEENLNQLKAFHREIDFHLLLNDSVELEQEGEKIALIGVENWGAGRFSKYGDLQKAMRGAGGKPFKILLSHDPSHWDAQVLEKTDIDLTFSGHTHGFQFGIEIPWLKWSPAQIKYPRWAGLYQEGKQKLYVNRGFGFIGFPGRVGIPPEITLVELKAA